MDDESLSITREKKRALEQELEYLENEGRDNLAENLENARSDSLSDETIVVERLLEEKEALDTRILEIKNILSKAKIMPEKNSTCNGLKIELGCEVTVKVNEKIFKFKVVDSLESNPFNNYISDDSPLGSKLLDAKLGDTIRLDIRGRILKYKILKIC